MTNRWNFQNPTDNELRKRDALAEKLGVSPVIASLLEKRGITEVEETKRFFHPSLNDLHDPFLIDRKSVV